MRILSNVSVKVKIIVPIVLLSLLMVVIGVINYNGMGKAGRRQKIFRT